MKNFGQFSSTAAHLDFGSHHTDGTFGYVRPLHPKILVETPKPCETSLPPYRHECQFEIRVSTTASVIAPESCVALS